MALFASLRSLFGRPRKSTGAERPRCRPNLESLEDRFVPAAINADYVAGVVQAMADRQFDPAKDQGLVNALDAKQLSILDVAAIVQLSDDAINANIKHLYNDILLRDPDAFGQAVFFSQLKAGAKLQDVKAVMFASDEYFRLTAGGNNSDYLSAVFADQLGRVVDPVATSYFGNELNDPALGTAQQRRELVARQVISSPEGAFRQANFLFHDLLVREADATGLDFYGSQLTASPLFPGSPVAEQEIIALLVGSQEFFARS